MILIATIVLVIGAIVAIAGLVLSDVPERGTRLYKVYRVMAMTGALGLLIGFLLFLSSQQITEQAEQCNTLNGVWLLDSQLCLDKDRLPIIELPVE